MSFVFSRPQRWTAACALVLLACTPLALCAAEPTPLTLAQAFSQAWAQQPEAQALAERQQASSALRDAAGRWTPGPPALEASVRSDRFNRRQGAQEIELGVALPLWLPGERLQSQNLADAQRQAVDAQARLAQWQLAQQLREHWWRLQAERESLRAAQARWRAAQQLAADVGRRQRAGELARADQHQADAAVAAAAAEQALALGRAEASEQQLRALLGLRAEQALALVPEPERDPEASLTPEPGDEQHPLLAAWRGKAASARSAAALARTQTRAHPELTLLQTRDREARGAASQATLTLGLRIPLGDGDRRRAALAAAGAEQTEAEVGLQRERERVRAERRAALASWNAARVALQASEERARLAAETRGFFERAFQLGESDLPTRLRVELDAYAAERERALARIALHQAQSQVRQSLGLLPE